MDETIKPCPFCGTEAALTTRKSESLWNTSIVDWFTIKCPACDIQMIQCDNRELLLQRWNSRHAKT